ncbi:MULTISPECIES: hypothetical protein [Chryseobacterium]|uniref:hypothetical protein n=1 Tax=Chryseobacterium TaxID=59732 RepID=UPI001556F0C5|nr:MULTISPECIES: hypothetical protein [unclassified Chryseobacterium]MDC8104210.1 hypothetical protein [Chryseobacterium sp. B21-037]MDQ1803819.1 hypothetical protein [Chryseobacterium sp. CKR4-1]WBV57743.1 hypothetical protein PFY10_04695 [Chryseobacterium daecheongense]
MKKLLLVGAFALLGSAVNAQEGFKLGGHIGIPVADASDVSSFTLGVDASYMWNITKGLDLGVASGYSHFFGKDNFDDFGFIPVAVSGKYKFSGAPVFVGLDLGYAISVKDGMDGGFYAQPKFGYQMSKGELYIGYQSISNRRDFGRYRSSWTIGAVNIGYNFYLR